MDVLSLWQRFKPLPAGRFLFSKILSRKVPYSGSVKPEVLDLEVGFARVQMKDRPSLRNHLESLHAISLMNIAELSTGLAVMSAMPQKSRAILKGLSIEYVKKARGTIIAESRQEKVNPLDPIKEKFDLIVESELKDASGDVVCKAKATWMLGPAK